MCGFRVYPLQALLDLDRRQTLGARMNFDIEVVVRLYWAGIEIINLPTPVIYPEERDLTFSRLVRHVTDLTSSCDVVFRHVVAIADVDCAQMERSMSRPVDDSSRAALGADQ